MQVQSRKGEQMTYFLNLFTPETWPIFLKNGASVSGFRIRQESLARNRVRLGDIFICYLTGVSRWCGVLQVESSVFIDHTPVYSDPEVFVVRFKVRPIITLNSEHAIPVHSDHVWPRLTFTRNHEKNSSRWTGFVRGSLNEFLQSDGEYLVDLLEEQHREPKKYPFTDKDKQRLGIPKGECAADPRANNQGGSVSRDATEKSVVDQEVDQRDSLLGTRESGEEQAKVGRAATESLSFADAAERILQEADGQSPMHYVEITRRALDRKLIRTEGRTPAASMNALILTEIKRQEERGESPRFVRHGRGLVGLTAWLPDEVASLIEERNREVREALLERARSTSPDSFESLVEQLLVEMGFEGVAVTPSSGDGGIDVRGTLVVGGSIRIRMAVQAKRWKGNVQKPVVQQVRGSLGAHEQGLIITTSDFSPGAREEAQRSDAAPVALIGGEQLAALLAEHEIGARMTSYELYTLDEVDSADA